MKSKFRTGPISGYRVRDEALDRIVPLLLGILWEAGQMDRRRGSVEAQPWVDMRLGGCVVNPYACQLTVCVSDSFRDVLRHWTKVISVYVVPDSSAADPDLFRYQAGRCRILSWKQRGPWEDKLLATNAKPRSISQLLEFGLTRTAPSLQSI
jgi:hypothetical protein